MTHDGNITAPITSYLIPLIRRLDHKEFYLFSGRQPERNVLEDRSKEESNKTSTETTVMQLPDTGRIRSRRRTRPSLTVQEQLNTNPLTNYIRKRGIRASNNRESSASSSNSSGRQRQRSTATRRSSRIASVKIKQRSSRNAPLQMKPRVENEKPLLPKETEEEINDTVIIDTSAEETEHLTNEEIPTFGQDPHAGEELGQCRSDELHPHSPPPTLRRNRRMPNTTEMVHMINARVPENACKDLLAKDSLRGVRPPCLLSLPISKQESDKKILRPSVPTHGAGIHRQLG